MNPNRYEEERMAAVNYETEKNINEKRINNAMENALNPQSERGKIDEGFASLEKGKVVLPYRTPSNRRIESDFLPGTLINDVGSSKIAEILSETPMSERMIFGMPNVELTSEQISVAVVVLPESKLKEAGLLDASRQMMDEDSKGRLCSVTIKSSIEKDYSNIISELYKKITEVEQTLPEEAVLEIKDVIKDVGEGNVSRLSEIMNIADKYPNDSKQFETIRQMDYLVALETIKYQQRNLENFGNVQDEIVAMPKKLPERQYITRETDIPKIVSSYVDKISYKQSPQNEALNRVMIEINKIIKELLFNNEKIQAAKIETDSRKYSNSISSFKIEKNHFTGDLVFTAAVFAGEGTKTIRAVVDPQGQINMSTYSCNKEGTKITDVDTKKFSSNRMEEIATTMVPIVRDSAVETSQSIVSESIETPQESNEPYMDR